MQRLVKRPFVQPYGTLFWRPVGAELALVQLLSHMHTQVYRQVHLAGGCVVTEAALTLSTSRVCLLMIVQAVPAVRRVRTEPALVGLLFRVCFHVTVQVIVGARVERAQMALELGLLLL